MQQLSLFFINIVRVIDVVIVPVIFSVAFVVFLWGVFRYFIAGAGDEEKRKEGRKFITWSIIGFFLMFAVWGIVNLLINSLGFDTRTRPVLPLFGGKGGKEGYDAGYVTDGYGNTVSIDSIPPIGATAGTCGFLGISAISLCPTYYDCVDNVCTNRDGD